MRETCTPTKANQLLATLSAWTSPRHEASLAPAFVDLYRSLHRAGILGALDVELALAWVEDLNASSYTWPTISTPQPARELPLAPIVDERRNEMEMSAAKKHPRHKHAEPGSSRADATTSHDHGRALVILFGSIRGGELTWASFYDNLLNTAVNPQVDLALSIGSLAPNDPTRNSSLLRRARYLWFTEEVDDWGEHIDALARQTIRYRHDAGEDAPASVPDWRTRLRTASDTAELRELYKWKGAGGPLFGGVRNRDGTRTAGAGAIQLVLRWRAGLEMMRLHLFSAYHRIVVARTDLYYTCPVQLSTFDTSSVWVPEGQDWGGLNDRWMACSGTNMAKCLFIFDRLILHPDSENYTTVWPEFIFENASHLLPGGRVVRSVTVNPETFLWRMIDEQGLPLKRFRNPIFAAASEADLEKRSWSVGHHDRGVEDRYHVLYKYKEEEELANQTVDEFHCQLIPPPTPSTPLAVPLSTLPATPPSTTPAPPAATIVLIVATVLILVGAAALGGLKMMQNTTWKTRGELSKSDGQAMIYASLAGDTAAENAVYESCRPLIAISTQGRK